MAERQWAGDTFGNGWMHRNLIRILRFTDVRVLYVFTDIFIIPFCLLLSKRRNSSYSFYRKRLKYGMLKSCWFTCKNFCMFSRVVIDRFAMYAGKKFEVEVVGKDLFESLVTKDEGFLHLSSHVGNYEIAGYTLGSYKKIIHAVVYSFEKESVMKNRHLMFDDKNVSMIVLKEDMSHLFEIDQAICNGDIVSFPSDRHVDGSRCISSMFFGEQAKFPVGPFSVATMRGISVLAVNVMKDGLKKYKIYLRQLAYDTTLPRREQIRQLSDDYVAELERIVLMYPAQWYNFFDFWAR